MTAGLVLSLSGCRAIVARFWDKAHLTSYAELCPDFILAVGDSIQFRARIMISNAPGGMSGPFNNVTLYTSEENPKSFAWRVEYAPPGSERASGNAIGLADITRTGILIAKDTGVVYVHVRAAGKEASRHGVRIISRVASFALHPRDTSVRVGDTIFLRADAELAAPYNHSKFNWSLPIDTFETRRVERVEQDPDATTRRDFREYPLVALRAGEQKVATCFAGARRDTATIRITGEFRSVNRNVAPTVRRTPADTTVYVGEELFGRVRVLNARLNNGPYRWVTTTGDGATYRDSTESHGAPSAYGFDANASSRHHYFEPGKYPVVTTVTDSAGRSTVLRGTYTAVIREFETVVLLAEGRRLVRLRDGEPDIAIALLANKAKRLYPGHITLGGMVRTTEVPPLRFGRTVFDQEPDGRRRVTKDVNGDGEPDNVFYLDKATLIRNGDLRVGRNRLVVTGTAGPLVERPGREFLFSPPIRAVVEFDAIP